MQRRATDAVTAEIKMSVKDETKEMKAARKPADAKVTSTAATSAKYKELLAKLTSEELSKVAQAAYSSMRATASALSGLKKHLPKMLAARDAQHKTASEAAHGKLIRMMLANPAPFKPHLDKLSASESGKPSAASQAAAAKGTHADQGWSKPKALHSTKRSAQGQRRTVFAYRTRPRADGRFDVMYGVVNHHSPALQLRHDLAWAIFHDKAAAQAGESKQAAAPSVAPAEKKGRHTRRKAPSFGKLPVLSRADQVVLDQLCTAAAEMAHKSTNAEGKAAPSKQKACDAFTGAVASVKAALSKYLRASRQPYSAEEQAGFATARLVTGSKPTLTGSCVCASREPAWVERAIRAHRSKTMHAATVAAQPAHA